MTMLHVYIIPTKRSDGYCFAGPVPIPFGNVDWMGGPDEQGLTNDNYVNFVKSKKYWRDAPVGTRFLLLCDGQPGFPMELVR